MKVQKRLAAQILKCSKKKIRVDMEMKEELKESITKKDIRNLVKQGAIYKKKNNETSRGRARSIQKQKSKGKRKGPGSKKGKINSRLSRKDRWMLKIRTQRKFLKDLKMTEQIDNKTYADLYKKAKGGFFRSKRHIKLYLEEHELIKNEKA